MVRFDIDHPDLSPVTSKKLAVLAGLNEDYETLKKLGFGTIVYADREQPFFTNQDRQIHHPKDARRNISRTAAAKAGGVRSAAEWPQAPTA